MTSLVAHTDYVFTGIPPTSKYKHKRFFQNLLDCLQAKPTKYLLNHNNKKSRTSNIQRVPFQV